MVLAVTQLKGRRMNKSESFESVDYRGTNLYEEHQDKVIKVLIFTASTWENIRENITKRIDYNNCKCLQFVAKLSLINLQL